MRLEVDDLDALVQGVGEHPIATEVAERVRGVIGAAEAAAGAMRHEAEQAAQARRRAAEQEARDYLAEAKRDAQLFLEERVRRIGDLSDTIIERAETILSRLDRAEEVKRQLQTLVDALGDTAAELAEDAGRATWPGDQAPAPAAEPEPRVAESEPLEPHPVEPEPLEPEPLEPEPVAAEAEPVEAETVDEPEQEAELTEPIPLRGRAGGESAATPRPRADDDDQLAARLVALQMAVAGANRGEVEVHLRDNFGLAENASILDDVFGSGSDAEKRVTWPEAAPEGRPQNA